jgi:DNA-binding MurR/RpiR family transcriptional regulator
MPAGKHILDHFADLSPTLQAAARFIVDHPNEVVISSMRSVAERAGAQPSTLVRLAQQLGYDGWPGLKSAFAADLGLHGERYGQRAKNLAARGRGTDLVGEMFKVQQHNMERAQADSGPALRAAATLLKQVQNVYVAGFRASHPIAYSLVYCYRLFRNTVHLVDGHGGAFEMQLRPIGRQDAVVAISFAPYSREALQVVKAARAVGAKIVALTDSQVSPLAVAADVAVLFSVESPSFFPSIAAAVAVSEALLELVVADGGAKVVQQIDRAEQHLFDSGAYLQPPSRRGARR